MKKNWLLKANTLPYGVEVGLMHWIHDEKEAHGHISLIGEHWCKNQI
jgi:hypothetical protein